MHGEKKEAKEEASNNPIGVTKDERKLSVKPYRKKKRKKVKKKKKNVTE